MKITATLKHARWINQHDNPFLSADIHNDIHKRWEDGTHIFTSFVVKEHPDNVYETRSGHFYKVENWRGKDH